MIWGVKTTPILGSTPSFPCGLGFTLVFLDSCQAWDGIKGLAARAGEAGGSKVWNDTFGKIHGTNGDYILGNG